VLFFELGALTLLACSTILDLFFTFNIKFYSTSYFSSTCVIFSLSQLVFFYVDRCFPPRRFSQIPVLGCSFVDAAFLELVPL
jgi:hypothetical protein